jgi:hypothetical protein
MHNTHNMHYTHDMHYTRDMHYMHNTPPHKQFCQYDTPLRERFYQYGTQLRERFNSVYRQGCGKAAIAAMMLFVALAVSLLTRPGMQTAT